MMLIAYIIIPLLTSASALEKNVICTTPNGERANCVPVSQCDIIRNAILFLEDGIVDFAKKSQCGYDNEPLVCCGTQSRKTHANSVTLTNRGKQPSRGETLNELSDERVCGIQSKQDRIIGGTVTDIGEFPWMVALKYVNSKGQDGGFRCSGTLIRDNFVLTAAQCLFISGYNLTEVRLGEWDFTTNPDCEDDLCSFHQDIAVAERIPHSFYSRKNGNNDIALLRLERKVAYTDYVKPICLPPGSLPVPLPGTKMIISGWGTTESRDLSRVKLKAQVPVVSNEKCLEIYPNTTSIGINQVCAGGEDNVDACKGDSGGPLMRLYETDDQKANEQWYQEGIIYRGLGCGGKDVPSLYTRISRYNAWIYRNINDSD